MTGLITTAAYGFVFLFLLVVIALTFFANRGGEPEVEAPRESDADWAWPPRKTLP